MPYMKGIFGACVSPCGYRATWESGFDFCSRNACIPALRLTYSCI